MRPVSILVESPVLRARSPGLDVLRALFALWVALLAHGIPWAALAQGADSVPAWLYLLARALVRVFQPFAELHPAVVGFIVLSGYCIHRSGFRERREPLRAYGLRRFFRIVPVYLAASVAGLAALAVARGMSTQWAATLSGTQEVTAACLAAKLTGLAALVPAFHPCSYVGNAPLATVMFEIWLYVLYALFFSALVWRGREKLVWWICAATFVAGMVVAAGALRWPLFNNWWQNSSLWGALPYWWVGTLFLHPAVVQRARLIGLCAAAAWLAMTVLPATPWLSELHKMAFAFGVGALIVLAERMTQYIAAPLAALGRAGYSLYAFHAPLTYVAVIAGSPWWMTLALNIAVAAVAYLLLEKPCMQLGKKLAAASAPGAASSAPSRP